MALTGKNILVLGGTGNVGWGIVHAALQSGASVFVPSRNEESLKELYSSLGVNTNKLVTINEDISTEEGNIK